MPYYNDLVKEENCPFLCLTESHLSAGVLDAEIAIQGMTVYRCDRQQREKGGVVTYLREDLAVDSELKHSNSFCETLGLHIPKLDLALITIYRPPGCPEYKFKECLEEVTAWLQQLEGGHKAAPTILISGDFNLGFLDSWEPSTIEKLKAGALCPRAGRAASEEKKQALHLVDFAEDFFLLQYVDEATRKQNILDLIFTNNNNLIIRCRQVINAKLSDHNTIITELSYGLKQLENKQNKNFTTTTIPEYDFQGADDENWARMKSLLNVVEWEKEFENKSVHEMTNIFLKELVDKVEKTLEKKTSYEKVNKDKSSHSSNNRIPRRVRTLFRNKKNASNALKTVKSVKRCLNLRKKIEAAEEELKYLYSNRKSKLESAAIDKIKRNPKAFYAYAKRQSKTFNGVGPFLKSNGDPIEVSEAEALKQQYETVFSDPKEDAKIHNPKEFFSETTNDENIGNILFNYQDIRDSIDELSSKAASGPDGVPAVLLKKCKDEVSFPLEMIWKKSLETGDIPEIFKLAHVIPLHKPGLNRSSPASYRPVSLTSHLVKTFERVVKKNLQRHLEVCMKINDAQHGFRNQRSCLSQLLQHHDAVLRGLEEGANVDTVYLDFSKAFDKVDKGILCRKMKKMGIHGALGEWIFSFLSERRQVILANGEASSCSEVLSGVPQGTVLGPLLFIILINDICQSDIESIISLFADDTRLTKMIKNESDIENFQSDLDKVYQWSTDNNMIFNSTKFEVLKHGKNEDLKDDYNYLTPNNENLIERKEVLRDLGVLRNDKANFDDHINKVCTTVNQKVGWVLRTFQNRQLYFMKLIWKQLIQAHIDYCSQLWQPTQSSSLQRIENLLKKFSKKIPSIRNENYWNRLKIMKMNSQQRRLERYRIIYTWKALDGLVPDCGISMKYDHESRNGRVCAVPSIATKASERIKTLREQSLQVHGPKLFNCLPSKIRNLSKCGIETFKEELDLYLANIPDQPYIGNLIPTSTSQCTGRPSNSLVDQVRDRRRGRPGE